MNSETASKNNLSVALGIFADIKNLADNNKPLPWLLCQDSIRAALSLIHEPGALKFIDETLLRVILVMTATNPGKFGAAEKSIIEESIVNCVKIVVRLLPNRTNLLAIISRLFDPKIPFYYGSKLGYTYAPGYPTVRVHIARKFADAKGFQLVYEAIAHSEFSWLGCDVFDNICRILSMPEINIIVDAKLREAIGNIMFEKLLQLPDEVFKRESTDTIGNFIRSIDSVFSGSTNSKNSLKDAFFGFWFKCIQKCIHSSSFVLKLFAWEQFSELILEAKLLRPLASSYIVEGAGTSFINGIYHYVPRSQNLESLNYTKEPVDSNTPLITLFRCNMRGSKAKWWFISQADSVKPGTDADIDYYLHRSTAEEEREPSCFGWVNLHSGMSLKGIFPPPRLICGDPLLPPGVTREAYPDMKAIKWCSENEILNAAFSNSAHREIISRASKVVIFLVEYGSLNTDHLELIWNAALKSRDIDATEEILQLLVRIVTIANTDLVTALINFGASSLKSDDSFLKVRQFVEKFSGNDFKAVGTIRTSESLLKLISLTWDIFVDTRFSASSNNDSSIQDLLSYCFKQEMSRSIVTQKVEECKNELEKVERETRSISEDSISRVVHTLLFLISQSDRLNFEEMAIKDLSVTIISEIYRFIDSHRDRVAANEAESAWYSAELRTRFQLLRKYFSICKLVDLEAIKKIWVSVNDYPLELEEFFLFLKGSDSAYEDQIFSKGELLDIFDNIICSAEINWSQLGEMSLNCFKAFYIELESCRSYFPDGVDLPPLRGISTLWTIALSVNSPGAIREANDILIKGYETLVIKSPESLSDFQRIVFDYLNDGLARRSSSDFSLSDADKVTRCVNITQAALHKFGSGDAISHGARGLMSRFAITVTYKKVMYNYNVANNNNAASRFDNKGAEGFVKVEVHPYHTVKMLKAKVMDAANLGGSISMTIDFHKSISDQTRLIDLGLMDGSEISMTYQITYQHKSYEDDEDIYGVYMKTEDINFGASLIDDYSKFDCLISLCQAFDGTDVAKDIWNLLMALPTQPNMLELIKNAALSNNADYADLSVRGNAAAEVWGDVFLNTSNCRSAYLLQILDFFLQPSIEMEELRNLSYYFRDAFLKTNGLNAILDLLLQTDADKDEVNFTRLAVCLHIIYSLIFGVAEDKDAPESAQQGDLDLLNDLSEDFAGQVIDKLLLTTQRAGEKEDSGVVHDALVIITSLIRSPTLASNLISNHYSKDLIATVLRAKSKKVREIAADFAIRVGFAQSIVFSWLLDQLRHISHDDLICSELFYVLSTLFNSLPDTAQSAKFRELLAETLSEQLINYPKGKQPIQEERCALLGFLELLESVLTYDQSLIAGTELGLSFTTLFMNDFLLSFDKDNVSKFPICDTPATRITAFRCLALYLRYSQLDFEEVLTELSRLSRLASKKMHYFWGLQVSHDIKSPEIDYIGLKNQGCTCYMNSLLQVLFMCPRFRDAVLSTPIRECHRTALWHRDDIDLVGKNILFEWHSGEWRSAKIVGFDNDTHFHRVQYEKLDGTLDELISFNIHEGRHQRETGKVKWIPSDDSAPDTITEREVAAYRVLEQLQRTFCHMQLSKKRYFDPRPFVEACKTLNMNFNVYHQNDASEFCDQLFDRIETATKGKYTKKDMWKDVFLKSVFGGKMLTQKIPQDCAAFNSDKNSCGLWQTPRQEAYLKIELMIRGKENIEDSLHGLIQAELMDGDNKISCDVCQEKKAALMKTCIGSLPNMLLLHLKRFDLDYQTFETVKLNSRMAFPMSINMMRYTKEGVDQAEQEETGASSSHVDPDEYEYELQGILVHAGVAQGGHYYSYIRSADGPDQWYKFDDEDVSLFSSDQIAHHCFGGSSGNSSMEDDRTANALMLLYNRKKAPVSETEEDTEETAPSAQPSDLINGYDAFSREVQQANLQHGLLCFLVDPALHAFIRELLSSLAAEKYLKQSSTSLSADTDISKTLKWSPDDSSEDIALRIAQFGCAFLLDVVLHSRERSSVHNYLNVLNDVFVTYPESAQWFLAQLVTSPACTWMQDFLLTCSDALARSSFVHLVVQCVSIVAPKDPNAIINHFAAMSNPSAPKVMETPPSLLDISVRLVLRVMEMLIKAAQHSRTADEVFALIRDLTIVPSIANCLKSRSIVSLLCYFVTPEAVPVNIRAFFEKAGKNQVRGDYSNLLQNIFEAIASLIGVPQVRKINLLQDKSFWESELVPEARVAFTQIFSECSRSNVMDNYELTQYLDKVVGSTGQRATNPMIRSVMDRFGTSDNRLYLEGFLRYQADTASFNPKQVWRDLAAFGFRNDLSRASVRPSPSSANSTGSQTPDESQLDASFSEENKEAEGLISASLGPLDLPDNCKHGLTNFSFYECGLFASNASARAIAQRVCTSDLNICYSLIQQALTKLLSVASESTWNHSAIVIINEFLRTLLSIDDALQLNRLNQIMNSPSHGLAIIIYAERHREANSYGRINEYTRNYLLDRYVQFLQDLTVVPGLIELLHAMAERDQHVHTARGLLKLRPQCNLNYDELQDIERTVVAVSGAGCPEVNGEYRYFNIKCNAGFYQRMGEYKGQPARFTLYKCSMRSGGFQWFLSITPPNKEPGSNSDIDFYIATPRHADCLPPTLWSKANGVAHAIDPAPTVRCLNSGLVAQAIAEDDSDSSADIAGDEIMDESFISSNYSDA